MGVWTVILKHKEKKHSFKDFSRVLNFGKVRLTGNIQIVKALKFSVLKFASRSCSSVSKKMGGKTGNHTKRAEDAGCPDILRRKFQRVLTSFCQIIPTFAFYPLT